MDGARASRRPGFCLTLPRDPRGMDRLDAEIRRFLAEIGACEVFDLVLLAREAVANAMVHGLAGRTDGRVRFSLELDGADAVMEVEDPGDGFDWRGRAIRLPEGLTESGRGRYIIHAYADAVEYNDKGNRITIRKRLAQRKGDER
ncbi:MAG: ATP-binding protein [Desulfovibrionaceae bacterium]